ncbi:claudin-9-like [Hypomesus transpacificus]|uniref:claudin-9-like n=1 Tax=Hypomesus transpacificus TaxID=137520 RepID=UPI001F07DA6A|nr:claudin-9-like [Hypomesus transpacificus]
MASTGLQLLGMLLAVLGWVGGALVCAAPQWRVSAFVGGEIIVSQVLWEGLWMTCLSQSTGQIQCKSYDSTLALPLPAQAARGLTVLSLLLCLLALILGVAGAKATHCLGHAPHIQASKARLGWASGALFVLAGLVYLVPVCWTAYSVVRDFYDPGVAATLKRELGPALYLGWGAGVLLLVGGALLSAGSAPPPALGGGRSPKGAAVEVKQPEKSFV